MAQGTQPMRNYWITVLPVSCVIFIILIAPRLFLHEPYQEKTNSAIARISYSGSLQYTAQNLKSQHKKFLLKKCALTMALAKHVQGTIPSQQKFLAVTGYEGLCY